MNRLLRAKVADNKDPEKRGRLKLECPDILAINTAFPEWVEASGLFNWKGDAALFAIPEIGTFVELEMSLPSTGQTRARGVTHVVSPGMRWKPLSDFSEASDVPAEALVNYPDRMVLKTSAGHVLIFDRKTGELFIQEATEGTTLIYLGRGADTAGAFAVRFSEAETWANTHVHPTGIGPSGPATVPFPAAAASTVVKVK